MELGGDDVVARDDGAELDAVLASPERVRVHTRVGVIGVDEVVVAPVGEPAGDRVPASEAHLVPADLGDTLAVGEATDPAGKPAEARGASFLAVLEEHLEPDADPEEGHRLLAREADQLDWRRCPVELTSPDPVVGRWDRGLLDQIFSNLLSNAMKYGHGKPISVSLRPTPTRVRLEIRDQGIGIAAGDQARIFEKFERAAEEEKGSSLGIGLWLTREMVRAMGGSIRVQSVIGAGSTFMVELPRSRPARPGKGKPA